MPQSLTWSDLGLTAVEKAALERFALSDPEAVVSLAKGSPELLSRVLSPGTVQRLQTHLWLEPRASKAEFKFGVPLGQPDLEIFNPRSGPDFESERQQLLAQLGRTRSSAGRQTVLRKLKKLYGGVSGTSRPRSRTGG